MKKILSTVLGLSFLVTIILCVFWILQKVYTWFNGLNSNIAVAIVAGSATIFASVIAIVLGRYYESKKDREAAHRDKKILLYDEFTEKLFDIFAPEEIKKKTVDLVPFLREVQRKLILWSGPSVIISYAKWRRTMSQTSTAKAQSMIDMVDFFLTLREDLGLSNKGIKKEYLVQFMIRESDLFMAMYEKNKNITFNEIAAYEETLKKGKA